MSKQRISSLTMELNFMAEKIKDFGSTICYFETEPEAMSWVGSHPDYDIYKCLPNSEYQLIHTVRTV